LLVGHSTSRANKVGFVPRCSREALTKDFAFGNHENAALGLAFLPLRPLRCGAGATRRNVGLSLHRDGSSSLSLFVVSATKPQKTGGAFSKALNAPIFNAVYFGFLALKRLFWFGFPAAAEGFE
jgi:hypothetical protein